MVWLSWRATRKEQACLDKIGREVPGVELHPMAEAVSRTSIPTARVA